MLVLSFSGDFSGVGALLWRYSSASSWFSTFCAAAAFVDSSQADVCANCSGDIFCRSCSRTSDATATPLIGGIRDASSRRRASSASRGKSSPSVASPHSTASSGFKSINSLAVKRTSKNLRKKQRTRFGQTTTRSSGTEKPLISAQARAHSRTVLPKSRPVCG